MTKTDSNHDPKKLDREVLTHYRDGAGRNEIARRIGVSTRKVSESCGRQGLTFDADRTAAAVAVHSASAGEAHRRLAGRFRDLADQALDRANDNICSPDVMWPYIRAAATATDKSIALTDLDARVRTDTDMATAMQQFQAFGDLVRGAAAAQNRDDVPP